MVTVTLALPTPVAVTTPALLTVRTLLLDDENVTFLFVALGGKTIIGSLRVVPFLPFASTVKAELCADDSVPNLAQPLFLVLFSLVSCASPRYRNFPLCSPQSSTLVNDFRHSALDAESPRSRET